MIAPGLVQPVFMIEIRRGAFYVRRSECKLSATKPFSFGRRL
jgi:hypothetical protein